MKTEKVLTNSSILYICSAKCGQFAKNLPIFLFCGKHDDGEIL